jgi:hypothetical protein
MYFLKIFCIFNEKWFQFQATEYRYAFIYRGRDNKDDIRNEKEKTTL